MVDHHAASLDILLAALKEAKPDTPLATILSTATVTPHGVTAPQAASFTPTLALSRHRELLTQFITATGVDLASNHDAMALLTQLHALADDIHLHISDACEDLGSACEGLELFVSLMGENHHTTASGSQVCSLLHPLIDQLTRASRAVAKLL